MSTRAQRGDWLVYGAVIVAEAAYILLTTLAPKAPNQNTFGLSSFQIALLQLTIVVPYLIAWLAGTQGALGFKRCGETAIDKDSAGGFRAFGVGVAVLVGGGLISAIISGAAPYYRGNQSVSAALTIANNYAYVLTNLISFLFLYRGATELVPKGENRRQERDDLVMAALLAVIIAVLYLPLVFSNPSRQVSANAAVPPTYYVPDAVIVATIILPYLLAWVLGFLTSLRIGRYSPPERDAVQRKSVKRFVNGLWMLIFSSILLQLLVSIGSGRLLALGIGWILGVIYLFLVLQIVGFLMVSRGSKGLCRIMPPERKLEVKAVTPMPL